MKITKMNQMLNSAKMFHHRALNMAWLSMQDPVTSIHWKSSVETFRILVLQPTLEELNPFASRPRKPPAPGYDLNSTI